VLLKKQDNRFLPAAMKSKKTLEIMVRLIVSGWLFFALFTLNSHGWSSFLTDFKIFNGDAHAADISSTGKYRSLDDLKEKRFAVFTGTVYDGFVTKTYPQAHVLRFETTPDMILALKSGKADVMLIDLLSAQIIMKRNPELGILATDFLNTPCGVGFSRNEPDLRSRFNNYLVKIRSNGLYNEIYNRWFTEDTDNVKMPDIPVCAAGKRYIMGVAVDDLPYIAFINGNYVGFDIELMKRFAMDQNIRLDIMTMEFSALVPALASGKVSLITDGIAITEERSRLVDFSIPYVQSRTAAIVLKSNMPSESGGATAAPTRTVSGASGLFCSIRESFYRNIVVEDRWKIILDGLKVTFIISALSSILGTLLGALICSMRMSAHAVLNLPARIYISIMRGTPVLVVLMLIFYVVFASVEIDPVLVAVIAFGLNFAAYVSEIFRAGIQSIDRGQSEAGIAIGFTRFKTFMFIILPQTIQRILPVYKGEFISLVKMTSIVGYIAVQDLAKASDIIRSRTFDAFFPLVMVAVLYFAISWTLLFTLEYLEHKTDPKFKRKHQKA
jgi:polar amino acid transport system substrate-binding protein